MKIQTSKLALAALLCAATAAHAAPVKSAKGYQITGPTGWKLDRSGFMGTDLFFLAPRQGNYSSNINVVVSPVPPGTTLAAIRAQTATMMPRMLNGFKLGAIGSGSVAGAQAMTLSGTYLLGTPPRKLKMVQRAALRNNKLFVFTHTALTTNSAKTEPAFQKVLATVKWTK